MLKTKIGISASAILLLASFALSPFVRAETLKIGFVTDWEYGKQKKYDHKLPKKASGYLKNAVNHYNKAFQPDLVVGGGDYILARSVSKKSAAKQMRQINKIFQNANAPRLYCMGNHDLTKFSKDEVKANLGIDYSHSVTDKNGVRIITLDTNFTAPNEKSYGMTGRVSDEELQWLEEKLNTDFPVIVFSHQSSVNTPQGNGWRIDNLTAEKTRNTLEKYGNVVAVFSGHTAVNYTTDVNGIHYVIINNLTDEKAKNSFADIIVEKNGSGIAVSVSQYGSRPATYNFSKLLTD